MHRVVLEDRDDSSGPNDARDMLQHEHRIRQAVEALRAPHEVECSIGKRERLRSRLDRRAVRAVNIERDVSAFGRDIGEGSSIGSRSRRAQPTGWYHRGMIDDTHPTIAAAQLDMLRRAGCGRRAGLARSLSRTVIGLSRRELSVRMGVASAAEVELRWVERQYGGELARRLRAFLAARHG